MTRRFEAELERLRGGFPVPGIDLAADEALAEQIATAVRQSLRLKTAAPRLLLSSVAELEAEAEANKLVSMDWPVPAEGLAAVVRELCECLEGLPLETHPRNQVNVNAQPSTAGIIGSLLPALFNPNLTSDGRGAGCSRAERRVVALAARLAGYEPAVAGGLFTFGGTGTVLYGVKLGLETAIPGAMRTGIDRPVVVLASERAHHTCLTAAGWLGIGEDRVWRVPAEDDFAARSESYAACACRAIEAGYRIAAMVATVGTTDAFGVDDVASLVVARDRIVADYRLDYVPHVHADAVIGWAWNVFRDYDFEANLLEFDGATSQALKRVADRVAGLRVADSLGVDFHKTGFAPYVSSLFLVRRGADLERLARRRDSMPYLFHSGRHHPGLYSLETTRSASGVLAAFASLRMLGRDGLRVLLGAAIARTQQLRERLGQWPWLRVVNASTDGPVTLYRAYPPDCDAAEAWNRELRDPSFAARSLAWNAYNRRIHEATQAAAHAGGPAGVGWTESACLGAAGQPLAALKTYLLSPFLDGKTVEELVQQVRRVRDRLRIEERAD